VAAGGASAQARAEAAVAAGGAAAAAAAAAPNVNLVPSRALTFEVAPGTTPRAVLTIENPSQEGCFAFKVGIYAA
jgi:hypothetical protein